MESPSLKLFKKCLDLVMCYGIVVSGLQWWHLVELDELKGLFQPQHFYNFMKCFWIFSLVLVAILRSAKIKVHICGINIGISICTWIIQNCTISHYVSHMQNTMLALGGWLSVTLILCICFMIVISSVNI